VSSRFFRGRGPPRTGPLSRATKGIVSRLDGVYSCADWARPAKVQGEGGLPGGDNDL